MTTWDKARLRINNAEQVLLLRDALLERGIFVPRHVKRKYTAIIDHWRHKRRILWNEVNIEAFKYVS